MLSSTSSSSRRLPRGAWLKVLAIALVVTAGFAGVMELRLAARGYRPAVDDSESLWAAERQRAVDLGRRALILVGASRMQLDIDLDMLRRRTGLEPVQLAIDGSSFVPILRGLAADPGIVGTVLVDFMPHMVSDWDARDAATQFEADYERRRGRFPLDAEASEQVLSRLRARFLRSYADGATPFGSLTRRILAAHPIPQYLLMRPDRSRLADYRRVPMPDFYYGRVMLALGQQPSIVPGTTVAEIEAELRRDVASLKPADAGEFRRHLVELDHEIDAIEARGGRVIVVDLPTSGLIRAIDERRYPREQFWDVFASGWNGTALNVSDDATLNRFICPDGSHLDYRDRPAFTDALVSALGLDRARLAAANP